jgi:WD40 repeat protein/serine/threonine protein kinase/tetratricopeptide (TPR) repeat protein
MTAADSIHPDWASSVNEQSIFLEALEQNDPETRRAFLDQACAGDVALRNRVERLLARHVQVDAVLDAPLVPNGGATITYKPVTEGPGSVIGPYKLLQQIGEGGFGVVYMAEQERPVRRIVALKIIKPGMDTAQVIARFESERQALALMDHPHIAKVFDAGATESGRPYFVMELVKGVPITEFCDKNHMPAEERLKLFIDVCHAIQHAHHKGIIHRDIKPSNVMVTLHDGVPVVKVIDFGVAKATVQKLTERTLFTAYGAMVGTPAYMSPEQAEMSGLDIDTRSDIFSLGVLLYELLTGTTPLESKRLRAAGYAEMQRLIREEEPPRPSTRLSSLGDSATVLAGNRGLDVKRLVQLLAGDLDWVVMKALEKDRNRRYATPGGFAEDIERYLRRDAVLARSPTAIYKLQKFVQRNRAAALTGAAVAAALLIGMAVATWEAIIATQARRETYAALQQTEHARSAETEQRRLAQANEQRAVSAFADADRSRAAAEQSAAESRERLVRLHVANGVRLMDEGDLFSALPPLVEALRLDQGDAEREEVHRIRIGAVLRQCPKLVQVWASEQPVTYAEFSPDGQRVLMVSDKSVAVCNVDSGTPTFPPLIHDLPVAVARFSPDGKRIAAATGDLWVSKQGEVHLWDALVGTRLGQPLLHPDAVYDVSFHPHNGSLVTVCDDNKVRLWTEGVDKVVRDAKARQFGGTELRSYELSNKSRVQADVVYKCRFTPDGSRILVTFHLDEGNDGRVVFWNPTTDALVPSVSYDDSGHANAQTCISPDGRFFWAQRGVRDATTGAALHPQLPLGDTGCGVPYVAFSPDSRMVVAGHRESGDAQVWDAARGARIGRPLEHRGIISAVDFSPDAGKVLTASVDGTARVWDAGTGKANSPPLLHGGSVTHARFSPTGHQVLTVSTDRTVRLWDLAQEEPAASRLFVTRLNNRSAPSNSGKYILSIHRRMAALGDPEQGLRRTPYFAIGGGGQAFDFNEDDLRLVIGTTNKTATVWDVRTGRRLFGPLEHAKEVHQTSFIGDGSRLLTVAQDWGARHLGVDLRLWDSRTGQPLTPIMTVAAEFILSTDVSPDGSLLAAVGTDDAYERGALSIWDARSGRLLWSQKLPRYTHFVMFSPDGRFLATATNDDEEVEFREDAATIWDVATGEQKWVFRHEARVAWMDYHPTDPYLVTASSDRTIRLWNYETGQPLGNPLVHPRAVQDVAFIANGRFIASATDQGHVRLWNPHTGEPISPWLPRAYYEYSHFGIGGDNSRPSALKKLGNRPWNTISDRYAFDELVALANLFTWNTTSGNQSAANGQIRWNAETFRQSWRQLKAAYPADFSQPTDAIVNWHKREALEYTNSYALFPETPDPSPWHAAAWHVDRLLTLLPEPERNWLIFRAGIRERLSDVDGALADYAAALDLAPRDSGLLERRANIWIRKEGYANAKEDLQRALAILFAEHQITKADHEASFPYFAKDILDDSPIRSLLPKLCLLQDDRPGYRRVCEQLVELSRQDTGDADFLNSVAWACVLTPEGFVDPPRILAMANRAVELASSSARLRTHGAALYRAGKFDEAAKRLEEALALQPDFPTAWLFLAMTEHRRDHLQDAKQWLDKAAEWIEREQPEKKRSWRERVHLDVLLREGQELLMSSMTKK